MKFQSLTLFAVLFTLVSCNEEVSSNRAKSEKTSEPTTPDTTTYSPFSGIFRSQGSAPLTYQSEISISSESSTVHAIPDMTTDDDGGDDVNVKTVSSLGRPTVICGETKTATLVERITDCSLTAKNGSKALWDGTAHATSSEGSWALVTIAPNISGVGNYEVWLDVRTGMVWSDIIDSKNWCKASGSALGLSDKVGTDCQTIGESKSLCTNLDLLELPNVTWRLPTRQDYLQADLDGIRFVLTRGTNNFWTATTSSAETKRINAWTYDMTRGTFIAESMSSDRHIRCIGTPKI